MPNNIETTINSVDSITIDISGVTSEQRRLLKLTINYQDNIQDPENAEATIPNPMPLLVALLMDSMNQRKAQVAEIMKREAAEEAEIDIAEVIGTL